MRSVVVAILLGLAAASGCHHAKQTGPSWPAPSTTADDGGESIAPREHTVASAVEKSADADEADDDEVVESSKPAATSEDKPATPAAQPATPPADDVIITDDIIIEIDE
jgi:hypothetical protein